jgi:Rad3-related DNA helicase
MLQTHMPSRDTLPGIQAWAAEHQPTATAGVERAKARLEGGNYDREAVKRLMEWKTLEDRLKQLASGLTGVWVVDCSSGDSIHVEPLWPSAFAKELLFRDTPQVALFSATLVPKSFSLLGIPKDDMSLLTLPSPFPAGSWPLYFLPGLRNHKTPKVSYKMTEEQELDWLTVIDGIAKSRPDRRGIIHPVSYRRSQNISQHLASSQPGRIFTADKAEQTQGLVNWFKTASPANAVVVHPALSTGYNFPGLECEFQVIAKLPFQDQSNPIAKTRIMLDPEYADYVTSQELIQMCGRGMRSASDRCENFITDANILWWLNSPARSQFPLWFLRLFKRLGNKMPPIPPKLNPADFKTHNP